MSDYSQPRLSNAMAFLIFAKNALRLAAALGSALTFAAGVWAVLEALR